MKNRLLLALILILVPMTGSCLLFGDGEPDAIWVEREMGAASENVLWQVIIRTLGRLGYPMGAGLDPDGLVARTGWRRSMAPFKGRGYQLRARVEVDVLENDRYAIRVRVQRQDNDALTNPTDPRYAEWIWTGDDEAEAKTIMRQFGTYLDREIEFE